MTSQSAGDPLHPKPPLTLRERRRLATQTAVQDVAMRLFLERGYAATTVEQVAAEAGISPATFYRYFATKEDVVLFDGLDAQLVAAMREQPPELSVIGALRRAMRAVMGALTDEQRRRESARQRLVLSVPELRARSLETFTGTVRLMAELSAERNGLPPDHLENRVLAGAIMGTLLGSLPDLGAALDVDAVVDAMDEALALLDASLSL